MPPQSASPYFGSWQYPGEVLAEASPCAGLRAAFNLLSDDSGADAVYVELQTPDGRSAVILDVNGPPPDPAMRRVAAGEPDVREGSWHLQRLTVAGDCPVIAGFSLDPGEATEERLYALWMLAHLVCATVATRVRHDVGPVRLQNGDFDLLRDWETGPTQCAVMFADVRGSTQFSQILRNYARGLQVPGHMLDPRELVISACQAVGDVAGHYGWVDKFIGDGVMVVFTPRERGQQSFLSGRPDIDCALRAACTALHMRQAVQRMVCEWESTWIPEFRQECNETVRFELAVGISYGTADRALSGPSWRQTYTVFGDTVVVAKRLEEIAGRGADEAILVSGTLAARLQTANELAQGELLTLRHLQPRVLRGTAHEQEVWTVTAREQALCAELAHCLLCRAEQAGPATA